MPNGFFLPNGNCFGWQPNEWMTFQVGVKTLDGNDAMSCVGVGFASSIASVTVVMRAVKNGCGYPCTTCDPVRDAEIYVGTGRAGLKKLGLQPLTDAFAPYTFAMPVPNIDTVVVCRKGAGFDAEDVEVDAIQGTCPPL